MSSPAQVLIVHRIPGRVRLLVERLRGDPDRADRVADAVAALGGVRSARANAHAASLVIEHDPRLPLGELLPVLAAIPELCDCAGKHPDELAPPPPPEPAPVDPEAPTRTAERVLKVASRVNTASSAVGPSQLDLKLLIPGALVGYGIYRLARSPIAGPPHWIVLLKYGFDAFALLNQGTIRRFLGDVERRVSPAGR